MTHYPCEDAKCRHADGTVALVITPRERDLGEFSVRRVLPAAERRMVGPFVFFDHMGPATFPPGKGIQVRPHPHIGLSTITYLFDGEILHRDSLGYVQPIRAGAVNLMTAGKGIVHSERAGDDLDTTSSLHGIQSWMALPVDLEEMEPGFAHFPADCLPRFEVEGVAITVIMGEAFGAKSPVTTYSETLYLECKIPASSTLTLHDSWQELAAYVVTGTATVDDAEYKAGSMLVALAGRGLQLAATEDCRLMVIGGDSLGPRTVWWNLVSSSMARIEQAKDTWRAGGFARVPGDDEFIPLPER